MKIVFLDRDTVSPQTRLRPPSFAHRWVEHACTRPDEVAERIADADIVVVNKLRLGAEQLAQAPRLRLVAVAAQAPTTWTSRPARRVASWSATCATTRCTPCRSIPLP